MTVEERSKHILELVKDGEVEFWESMPSVNKSGLIYPRIHRFAPEYRNLLQTHSGEIIWFLKWYKKPSNRIPQPLQPTVKAIDILSSE